MGQKIHPTGFRLGITLNHQSKWFANDWIYPSLILEDYLVRNQFIKKFPNWSISKVEIQRKFGDQIHLIIHSTKPTIILNYYKNDLKNLIINLTEQIQKHRKKNFYYKWKDFSNFKNFYSISPKVTVQILEVFNPDANASFIADFLVEQLQNRTAFRKAMKKIIKRVQKSKVKGVKIQISGRLNGAEIARSEWIREGQIPLQTLRAEIDYCSKTAKTIYGILGIKVWIFKNNF